MPEHAVVQRVYDGLAAWARADEDGHLLDYVRALIEPLTEIVDIVEDSDAHEGWGSLMDLDEVPGSALAWLAQFVGVELIASLDDTSNKIRIAEAAGFRRGTPSAIVAAAKQFLTGIRKVELYEREGDPWTFRLRTYDSETPEPEKVEAAVLSLKPAGLILVYEIQQGVEIDGLTGTIDEQPSTIASYSDVVPA